MSFEILAGLAAEWAALLPDGMINDGPAKLLAMARSQFTHSWFNHEFMVTACLTGLQALEAAFRVLYPQDERATFRALITRARGEKASCPTASPRWLTSAQNCTTASRTPDANRADTRDDRAHAA